MKYQIGGGNMLFVKTLTGQTLVLDHVPKDITIKNLKKMISRKLNSSVGYIKPQYIRLVWKGRMLGSENIHDEKNNLQLNRDYNYNFGYDKGIHVIINFKKRYEDIEKLKSRQSLAFMSAFLEDRAPTNELRELSGIGSIMKNYIQHNPKALERMEYQDYGYDDSGYDLEGYDVDGYDRYGYNPYGYDREGYDTSGYDREGFNRYNYEEMADMANYLNSIRGGKKRFKNKKKYYTKKKRYV